MDIKNNKGEWSEWYTFLKILGERKVFAAYGKLYEDNGDLFFKLNLQIRFLH